MNAGILFIPALVHNFAYQYNYLLYQDDGSELVQYTNDKGKWYWDALFRKMANQINGMSGINYVAWLALFLFGWFAWHRCRKKVAN